MYSSSAGSISVLELLIISLKVFGSIKTCLGSSCPCCSQSSSVHKGSKSKNICIYNYLHDIKLTVFCVSIKCHIQGQYNHNLPEPKFTILD